MSYTLLYLSSVFTCNSQNNTSHLRKTTSTGKVYVCTIKCEQHLYCFHHGCSLSLHSAFSCRGDLCKSYKHHLLQAKNGFAKFKIIYIKNKHFAAFMDRHYIYPLWGQQCSNIIIRMYSNHCTLHYITMVRI